MTIHLYNQTKKEAHRLCERTLLKLGYSFEFTDAAKGLISAQKETENSYRIFFDIRIYSTKRNYIRISLISSVFSGNTAVFIDEARNIHSFMDSFNEILRIQPPDNPLKLTKHDYALYAEM